MTETEAPYPQNEVTRALRDLLAAVECSSDRLDEANALKDAAEQDRRVLARVDQWLPL